MMRTVLYLFSAFMVMGLAYWAYSENYKTQATLDEVEDLQIEIGRMQEELSVLRAEWAYLNRPDRLRDLAEMNFDRLGLLPLSPDQFGRVDQVAYPQEEKLELNQAVDVSGTIQPDAPLAPADGFVAPTFEARP